MTAQQLSMEISMYPLDPTYIPPIQSFIDHLNTFEGIKVITNAMSTQVAGDFETITNAVTTAIKESMVAMSKKEQKVVFVTKWLNADLL